MSSSLRDAMLVLAVLLFTGTTAFGQNDLQTIVGKLESAQQKNPAHKIFLSHDKPSYVAGETIWVSCFLMDAAFHQLNALSNVVYVDLVAPDGNVVLQQWLQSPLGISWGQIELPPDLPAGSYSLRAYTNYMRGEGKDYFYEEIVPVYNPDNIPAATGSGQDIDLQFFAEGGNFLIGIENTVAFKAVNENGLPAKVEGIIVDEQQNEVAAFKTVHDGLGSVSLTPAPGKKYTAVYKDASGNTKEQSLPDVLFSGYALKVSREADHFRLLIYRNTTDGPNQIGVVAQSRGITRFAAQGAIGNSSIVKIPYENLPTGITQLTIFDGNGQPVCERLVFLNHQRQLDIDVTLAGQKFGQREKVTVSVNVEDPQRQNPDTLEVFFTATVYDRSASPAFQSPMKEIVSYLYLDSDLRGYVHNPDYYFSSTSEDVLYHADLLMMTHGWRRFVWDRLLESTTTSSGYKHEKGIPIRGRITRAMSKKPYAGGQLTILNSTGSMIQVESDEAGEFYNDELVFFDSTELVIQTESKKGNQSEYDLEVYPPAGPADASVPPISLVPGQNTDFIARAGRQLEINQGYQTAQDAIMLEEVQIRDERIKDEVIKYYGMPDRTLTTENLPKSSVNIIESIRGRFAGVQISGNSLAPTISIRGGGTPLFILDGIQVNLYTILNIPPDQIASIDLIKGNNAAIFGSDGASGVLAFYTKTGLQDYTPRSLGMNTVTYPGFSAVREFYHPKYDVESDRNNLPDVRTTLFWSPLLKCEPDGTLTFDFYTADVNSTYEIVLQGITLEGNPGASRKEFTVEK